MIVDILVKARKKGVIQLYIITFAVFCILLCHFGKGGGRLGRFGRLRDGTGPVRTERTAPMRGTVASVDVVYCCLDLGSRKVGRTVAADTLTDSVVERKAGIVQDRGQLYKIGMTVTGNKSIALFILVNVVQKPCAGAHASRGMSGSGLRLRVSNGDFDRFRFFLIKSVRIMAGETATVRIFSTDVHLHARKIHFDTVFDDFKGQVMIFQITVDHYEELDAGPGRADMTGFHIRELSRPAEQFKDGYRRIVYIDHHASTIARHVFQLTTSFHHAAGDIEGQFFLVSISFILLAGFDKPTQIGDRSRILTTLHLTDVLIQGHQTGAPCLERRVEASTFDFFLYYHTIVY